MGLLDNDLSPTSLHLIFLLDNKPAINLIDVPEFPQSISTLGCLNVLPIIERLPFLFFIFIPHMDRALIVLKISSD